LEGGAQLVVWIFVQAPSAEENQYITSSDDDSAHLAEWQQKFEWERKIQAANRNLFGNRTFRYAREPPTRSVYRL
jgi:hypothetical protein